MRTRINTAIKVAESDNYFSYRVSRVKELKRNHEDNKEYLQEIFNRPVKVKVTFNCVVLINGIEIKIPTEIAQKAKYKIERYV